MLTAEEKEFLDRILDAGYEFIDGFKDWGWDHPIPEAYRDPMSENEIIDAMKGIRKKLYLTGESAWDDGSTPIVTGQLISDELFAAILNYGKFHVSIEKFLGAVLFCDDTGEMKDHLSRFKEEVAELMGAVPRPPGGIHFEKG